MAQTLRNIRDDQTMLQYVTFLLGKETYGIPILKLSEIIAYQKPTCLPNLPPYIKGVLNLRGRVIPVIDLRERFHMDSKNYDQQTVIMIIDINGMTMSLIVDGVSDVVSLHVSDIKPKPYFSSSIKTDFIEGMGLQDDRFIILLNVDKFLSDYELLEIHKMTNAA